MQTQRFLSLVRALLCAYRLIVDGLRGDLVTNRAAKALVAYEGRNKVTAEDIERVVSLCLNHRCVSFIAQFEVWLNYKCARFSTRLETCLNHRGVRVFAHLEVCLPCA